MARQRRRILTWHEHGNYLLYLTQVPHEFYVVTQPGGGPGRAGLGGSLPWGPNVHEIDARSVRDQAFDLVLYQSRTAWDGDRWALLSDAQRGLPRAYIEHDPPQQHPTDTRHWVDDPGALLVHVTPFNALMWDSGSTPTAVIEHGVMLLGEPTERHTLARGICVVNNLDRRGRRLGLDVYREITAELPIDLVGLGADRVGGLGEVRNARCWPPYLRQRRSSPRAIGASNRSRPAMQRHAPSRRLTARRPGQRRRTRRTGRRCRQPPASRPPHGRRASRFRPMTWTSSPKPPAATRSRSKPASSRSNAPKTARCAGLRST